jgi:hypothetical protein
MEMFKTEVLENHNKHVQNVIPENYAVYEIMWENVVQSDIITWRISFACQVTWARNQNTHMYHLLLFHCNDGYAVTPQFYVYMYTACLVHILQPLMHSYLNGAPRLA